jgi:subtilisin family serine protease
VPAAAVATALLFAALAAAERCEGQRPARDDPGQLVPAGKSMNKSGSGSYAAIANGIDRAVAHSDVVNLSLVRERRGERPALPGGLPGRPRRGDDRLHDLAASFPKTSARPTLRLDNRYATALGTSDPVRRRVRGAPLRAGVDAQTRLATIGRIVASSAAPTGTACGFYLGVALRLRPHLRGPALDAAP